MSAPLAVPPTALPSTQLALEERGKLVKSLSRIDMIGFTVCAFVGLDTLGTVASNGAQGFTWLIVLALAFVLPYGLLMSEVGSAFAQEGGPYEWVKLAFGRLHGAIAAILYWVTNPLWVGGSLAFIATEAWTKDVFGLGGGGSVGDYLFKLAFIWISIGVAVASLRRGKWIPNVGALLRVVVLGGFTLVVIAYAVKEGVHGFPASDLTPTGTVFLALVPLLLFNYVGFELQSGAAEEMDDPQRDVPVSLARSGALGVVLYAVPVFGIILVLPPEAITGIGGFLDAVTVVFDDVLGSASAFLKGVMAVAFVGTLLTSGSVWMIGSDRIQAVAAADGAFFPFFARFHARLGTPVRVNVLSGVVATLFMIAAVAIFDSGANATFVVVLTIAISTTLISYLWIFAAAVKLRFSHPGVHRPFSVPGGRVGIVVCGAIVFAWVLLGAWVAVFPGVLESVFGLDYDFVGTWGVGRGKFEALTLGTLAVVVVLGLIGYVAGAPERRRVAAL